MLKARILNSGCKCWLVNTGWIGGGYGIGKRIDIPTTRKIISAISGNFLTNTSKKADPSFGLKVPLEVPGIAEKLLNPRALWEREDLYDLANCDLIIEAATEDDQIKHKIFQSLIPNLRPGTILTSNTSSISITQIAGVTNRPDKVIGSYFRLRKCCNASN